MRKTVMVLSVLGLAVLAFGSAQATSLMTETFPYPDGGLVAVSGGNWLTHSGTTDLNVVTGTVTGTPSNSADDNRAFAAQTATSKTYACFLAKVPSSAVAVTGTTYFAHFKDTGTSNFVARVYVTPAGNTFTFAITVSSANLPTFLVPWTSALSFDTFYNIVIDYDAAAGTADMWVNPANSSSPKVTSSTSSGTTTGTVVSAFALRQGTTTGLPTQSPWWSFVVDNIGVGTTFDDACAASTIPVTPTTWTNMKALYN